MEKRISNGIFIPIEVWQDTNLSWNEKILFMEIHSYTSNSMDCFFSNQYIAKFLNVNETTASKTMTSLIKKGYVIKTKFDGRKRYVKTAFSFNNLQNARQTCADEQVCLVENDNILNKINNKDYKENKKEKITSAERAKQIVEFWNNETSEFPKVRFASNDIIKNVEKRLKDGYSIDDIKRAILLCNSLSDYYKGRGSNSNKWKATLQWLIANTKDNFNKILNGGLHTTNEQQIIYSKIMDAILSERKTEYHPKLDGFNMRWIEQSQCYMTTFDLSMLADGYTPDNRPSCAIVMHNGVKYQWDVENKKWRQL